MSDDTRDVTPALRREIPQSSEIADVMALVDKAVEKDIDVDKLERLMAMLDRKKAEWVREQYYAALADFQAQCPVIAKMKIVRNKAGTVRYRYAPIDAIVEQVRDLLSWAGFSYELDARFRDGHMIGICRSHHVAGHEVTTEFPVPIGSTDYMTEQQAYASARTFATRYAFIEAYGIVTADEDDDSLLHGEVEERRKPGKPDPQAGRRQRKVGESKDTPKVDVPYTDTYREVGDWFRALQADRSLTKEQKALYYGPVKDLMERLIRDEVGEANVLDQVREKISAMREAIAQRKKADATEGV